MDFWRKKKSEKERLMWEKGGILLEELIAACDGKCNPIRVFSDSEILEATNGFGNYIFYHVYGKYYKGLMENRLVMVKTYSGWERTAGNYFCRDFVVSAQMSSHNNALKLLRCSLEFPFPVLVFEYMENGALDSTGSVGSERTSLPWNIRLRIAKEIANAVTYLHTAFPRTIIHRDIKPTNVFSDESWHAKLSDFSLSISIPEGKTFVEDLVIGTFGFVDPIYFSTGLVTENTDVYGFGIFMLVLLTGKPVFCSHPYFPKLPDYVNDLVRNDQVFEAVDPRLLEDMGEAAEQKLSQMEAFCELSLRCTGNGGEEVPKMLEVAKELRRIERFIEPALVNPNPSLNGA